MLILGEFKVWVPMEGADGVSMLLSPLATDVDQRLVAETTERVHDAQGRLVDIKRDFTAYAQRVARECLHDWKGLKDSAGKLVAFSDSARDQLMRVAPAQAFLLREVPNLAITRAKLVTEAGNDSAASSSGDVAADSKH